MALVGKIREKSTLILIVVGLGLLLFIIPFDTIFQRFAGTGELPIGEMNGEEIYDSKWNYNERASNISAQLAGYPEEYKVQEESNFFRQTMMDTLINTEISNIGLRVGKDELVNLILGDHPSELIKQMHSVEDPATKEKVFVKDSVVNWYNNLMAQEAAAQGDAKAQIKRYLYNIEVGLKNSRRKEKYVAMAKYSVVATNAEVQMDLIAKNSSADILLAYKEANTVPDSVVSVSEQEIKQYYEQHKNEEQWKMNDDYVSFDYALIEIKASENDAKKLAEKMEKLKEAFATTTNDSSFVAAKAVTPIGAAQQNPQSGAFDVMPRNEFMVNSAPFSEAINVAINNGKKGDVIGPFSHTHNGVKKVVIAKITNGFERLETEVRHILVEDEKLADSLVSVLQQNNSKFSILGTQFSTDPGFASNGGYYNVYPEAGLVEPFKQFGLNGEIGEVKKVPTDFGFHVMEIVRRGDFNHNYVAYVDQDVQPSTTTKSDVMENVGIEMMTAAKGDFKQAAEKFNLATQEAAMILSYPILQGHPSITYDENLVKWCFAEGRKKGDVSSPFETRDGKLIVAKIKSNSAYGIPNYDAVAESMKERIMEEKKVKYLANQVKDITSIEQAAEILQGSSASAKDETIDLSMNAFPGSQYDPEALVEALLITDLNQVTKIEGKRGMYVVVVKNRNITPIPTEIAEDKKNLSGERQSFVEANISEALFKSAGVRDYRMKSKIAYSNRK